MYTIKMDGKTLYCPVVTGEACRVLNPKLALDVNTSGSLSFVLPPGNRMHSDIKRRKSIITVEQDGVEIFRGRVLDCETDNYKQKSVYCEGIRSYLNDSQAAPYSYTGTPRSLLEKLISEHNAQVEAEKQFTIGSVTIDRADEALECENAAYWETLKEIDEKLLGAYGGYLKVRIDDGVQYIDWLKEYGGTNPQKNRFEVNLLDIKEKLDSGEMVTILRPLGASIMGDDGEYSDALTIASVNDGLDYIADENAIAEYGRIWKTQTWPYIEDPAKLLDKAKEYMQIGAELRTITLSAIDMHFLSGSAQAIRIGDTVHIVSHPHGIDLKKVCCKMEIDLCNPESTTYTFGEAPKALTDNFVKSETDLSTLTGFGGGGKKVKEEMNGIIRWAEMKINAAEASIDMLTGEANSLENRLSKAEVSIDGINAQIVLFASRDEVDELGMRLTQAEIEIDGANAEIVLKASKEEVDELGSRVSSAEISIDGLNSEITLKADKVYVDAQITQVKTLIADEIDAAYSELGNSFAESILTKNITVSANAWVADTLTAQNTVTTSIKLNGSTVSTTTLPVVTSFTQASGETAETTDYTLLTTAVGDAITHDIAAGETKTFDAA